MRADKTTGGGPCVTLIIPLTEIKDKPRFDELMHKAENELREIAGTNARPAIEKMNGLAATINSNTDKKTVILFINHDNDQVFYTDAELAEQTIIDVPFSIRDLVEMMQPVNRYLLLVQSAENFRIFLGDSNHLTKLHLNTPDNASAYLNDIPEKTEYFTDTTDRKEIMLDKFIHHIDKELEQIRHQYPLPVFVIGPERMNGHFKKISHNEKAVAEYIHGNFDEAKIHELLQLIKPFLTTLEKLNADALKRRIEQALNGFKFSYGIEDVWSNVMHKRGNMLLVERDYTYPHNYRAGSHELDSDIQDLRPEFVKDAVDVIIRQVLENGGHVQYAGNGLLDDYNHIALFHYY